MDLTTLSLKLATEEKAVEGSDIKGKEFILPNFVRL